MTAGMSKMPGYRQTLTLTLTVPNPYPALNQKPNHTHESNSVFGEVSINCRRSMSCPPL